VLSHDRAAQAANTILRAASGTISSSSRARLAQHLARIFGEEKLAIREQRGQLLVRESGGSVRDALSLSDQLISYVGESTITSNTRRGARRRRTAP